MAAFLVEAYMDAVRGLWASVKLFWPIWGLSLLLLITGGIGFSGNLKEEPLYSLAVILGMLAAISYFFVIFCQGAVGWHRRLLLNEGARWISPIPHLRSLQYAWRAFLFVIAFWSMLLISTYVSSYLAAWLTGSVPQLIVTDSPITIEELEAFRIASIPMRLLTLASAIIAWGVVIRGGRSWLLAFPHVSVRSALPMWGIFRNAITLPSGFVGALLVAMFLPATFGTLYQSFTPISVQGSLGAIVTVAVINVILGILSLLCGLSIFSIAYRQAQVEQIPYREIDYAAQD